MDKKSFAATYLLGNAYAALESVQDCLVQGENNEALHTVNKAVQHLRKHIANIFYGECPDGEQESGAAKESD